MKAPIRWGLILGVAVAAMSFLFGLVGWHRAYEMSLVFLTIAILLNLVTVVGCLRELRSTADWVGQIKNGLIVGAVASVIIFLTSWLVTSVVFPRVLRRNGRRLPPDIRRHGDDG